MRLFAFLFCVSLFSANAAEKKTATPSPVTSANQLLLVITKDWETVPGTLHRYERNEKGKWQEMEEPIAIVVGRNGLGWGSGLHSTNKLVGPVKQEGDGKSPAGIFNFGSAFGLAEADKATWIKLPYQNLSAFIECVDDVKSKCYNTIVDRSKIEKPDWNSSEKMKEIGEQYRWGIVINHNVVPRVNGSGSCIFMHIWKTSQTGTSGCTAMETYDLQTVLRWLDPAKNPTIVQLPEAEYKKLKKGWELPDAKAKK